MDKKNIVEFESNIILKVFILFSILLLLPISELFIVPEKLNDGSLELFSIFMFLYLLITFFIANELKLLKNDKYYFFKNILNDNILLIFSLFSFGIFLIFILQYINSLVDVFLFASKYRQGFYKGSGLYTYPILIIVPSILALMTIKQKKLSKGFYISLLLVFVATVFVGLRIYLFSIVFLFLIRLLIISNTYKFLVIGISLFFVMFLYKYFLNDNVADMSFLETLGYMLGRSNFRSILDFQGFEMSIEDLKCMLYPFNQLYNCSTADFKEHFLSYNDKIPIGMPFISLYSGVAIAIPKILYNLGSPVFLSLIIPVLIILLYLLEYILKSVNITWLPFLVNIYILLTMALLEDIGALNKILSMSFIAIAVSILIIITNKKYIIKGKNNK